MADRDGGNARSVLEQVLYFDWYRDSRHIIFVRRGENNLAQVRAADVVSGEETLLLPDCGH